MKKSLLNLLIALFFCCLLFVSIVQESGALGATTTDKNNSTSLAVPIEDTNTQLCTSSGSVSISKHIATPSEINQLKSEIGVYEEGTNYSQIIDGYGTGFCPPTEQEWDLIAENLTLIDTVNTGLSAPTSIDQSATIWFPPIGDQGQQGSCTAWSIAYYMKTFQEAKEHNWNVSNAAWQTTSFQSKIMSPAFLYNLINGGVDSGSTIPSAIDLVCNLGLCSWQEMPYSDSDYTSWPSGDAWTEATLYRGAASSLQYIDLTTDNGVTALKNWIASGNLASIAVGAGRFTYLTSDDMWTTDNYYSPTINHANTIVGFDDNLAYTENGVTHYGAFKVANSWGVGFTGEHVPDGFYWISYNAAKQWVKSCYVYDDLIDYTPQLAASFTLTDGRRGNLVIELGMGNPDSPICTKLLTAYINGGTQQLNHNQFVFDLTEFKNYVPNIDNQTVFLKIRNYGTTSTTLSTYSVELSNSQDVPCVISAGSSVCISIVLTPFTATWTNLTSVNIDPDFTDGKIATATDSLGNIYVAYQDLYEASGYTAIFVKKSTDAGQTWLSSAVGYFDYNNLLNPAITIDPYSNDIFVAAELEVSANEHQIWVLRYRDSSWSWVCVDSDFGQDYRFPSISSEYQYDDSNSQYISYECVYNNDDRDLMFAKSTDHGVTWSNSKIHGNWPDSNVYTQTSLTNAQGAIYIAYRYAADFDSSGEIRVEKSTDFGSTWSQITDVDGLTNDCQAPSITAMHNNDAVMVAFQYQYSAGDSNICYSYSNNNGSTWIKGLPLFASILQDEKSVSLTSNNDGSIYAVCKAGRFAECKASDSSEPTTWGSAVVVSDSWVGEGFSVNSRLSSGTCYPYVVFSDFRTKSISFSIYDTIPPLGSIIINDGDTYTTSPAVTLTLTYSDSGSEVSLVRYSNDGTDWSAWETPASTKLWDLLSADGARTVYYQIKDNAGLISTYSDTIILDASSPTGSVVINNGDPYTTSVSVMLTLTYFDNGSGVSQVRFSDDGVWDTESWQSPVDSTSWLLTSGDGEQTVYYQVKDNVGFISDTYSASILLDTVAPTGSVVINSGDVYAASASVTLTLTGLDDGSGVDQMRFSNDGASWSSWEAFATTKVWVLAVGDGDKTVYFQVKDNVGFVSDSFSDTIVLDTVNPTGSILINLGSLGTGSTTVTLTLTYFDATSGVEQVRYSNDDSSWSSWETASSSRSWVLTSGDGEKIVYYQIRDNAGLLSETYNDTITLTSPSSGGGGGGGGGEGSRPRTPIPTATPVVTPTPTPIESPVTIQATTDTGQTVYLAISGNITVSQMSNVVITTNQASATTSVSFSVSGEPGEVGSGNVAIPKSAIPYGGTPKIYVDGVFCEAQGYTQDAENYYVWYLMHFSTHDVSIVFVGTPVAQTIPVWLLISVVVIVVVVVAVLVLRLRK